MKLHLISTIRTNNFNDEQMMEKIKKMWKEASQKLEHHDNHVYGLYFDYERNYKGDYSLSAAIEGHDGNAVIEIPNHEKYKVYQVDASDDQGIVKAWRKIWKQEEAGLLKRAYSYDFEKYYPSGEVEIHIAIK